MKSIDTGVHMAAEHNAALVRRAVEEIWNRGALDVADTIFTYDYVNHSGLIPNLVRGPEAIKISVALYRTAFPELRIKIDTLTAKRDAVLLRWSACRDPLQNGATDRATQTALTGLIVSRCAGGRIAESWMQWDRAGALAQLGLRQRSAPAGRAL